MSDVWESQRTQIAKDYAVNINNVISDANIVKRLAETLGPVDIASGTSIAPSGALVPDLEDFVFGGLIADPKLKKSQIEHNFEDALRYLAECASLRTSYVDISKYFLDTHLKAEEFFRLDSIHNLEIAAGLYEAPFHDTKNEFEATSEASKNLERVKAIAAELLSSGKLSPNGIKQNAGWMGEIAHKSANTHHARIAELTSETATYRSSLERQTWEASLSSTSATHGQLEAQRRNLERRKKFLEQDIIFKKSRTQVSRDVAYANLQEHTRSNSPLNYREQLDSLRKLYVAAARRLGARIRAVADGCNSLYLMRLDLPRPEKGAFFLAATQWMSDVQEKLQLRRRSEQIIVHTIWLDRPGLNLSSALREDGVVINIADTDPDLRSGLLRGMACEYVSSNDALRPIRLDVTPPITATSDVGITGGAVTLPLGRVFASSAPMTVQPSYSDILWNGKPQGAWRVKGYRDADLLSIRNVAIHLWIARS